MLCLGEKQHRIKPRQNQGLTGQVYILIIGSNGLNISSSSTQLTRPKIQITSPLKNSLHINFSSINFLSFPNSSQTLINTTLHPNLFQNTRIRYLSSMNFPIYHAYNAIQKHKSKFLSKYVYTHSQTNCNTLYTQLPYSKQASFKLNSIA